MEQPNEKTFDSELPPGTVRIIDVVHSKTVLYPRPSNDPNQPLNWSKGRKVLQMSILCVYTTLIFAILTVTPPLWEDISNELGVSMENLNYSYATAYCSLTVAALVFIPLSIDYGRRPVYIATGLIMLASSLWMANMKTTFDVIAANFLSGIAGSVNEALFNITICDLFFIHQRGTMTGIYLLVVVIGTYLSPIASGYIAVSQGWRWVFWHCTIYMGITAVVMAFFLEETKWEMPVLNASSVQETQQPIPISGEKGSTEKITTLPELTTAASCTESNLDHGIKLKSYRQRIPLITPSHNMSSAYPMRIFHHLYQPFLILGVFPAVMFSALQYAWSESMLSFLAVTQASLYPLPPYNFSAIGVGNMNIPPAIGAILGSLFGGVFSDYLIMVIAKRRNGIYEPEYRLWTFLIPGMSMVAGVLLYGLTIAQGMDWIINAVGAGLVGFALGGCGDIALTYVQDSYDGIIGPALIGIVFVRNGMATVMTFVIPVWQAGMGVYNMFLLLGVLAAVIALTCVPLMIWGRRWRIKLGDRYASLASSNSS